MAHAHIPGDVSCGVAVLGLFADLFHFVVGQHYGLAASADHLLLPAVWERFYDPAVSFDTTSPLGSKAIDCHPPVDDSE